MRVRTFARVVEKNRPGAIEGRAKQESENRRKNDSGGIALHNMSPDRNGIRRPGTRTGFVCHMAGVPSPYDDAVSHDRFTDDVVYITRVKECADNERYTVYLQGFRLFLCNVIENKYEFYAIRNDRITLVFPTIKILNVHTNVDFFITGTTSTRLYNPR